MGDKGDLDDLECGTVVGARQASLSLSKTADLLGLSNFLWGLQRKKEKNLVSGSCLDKNTLLMIEDRGEYIDWLNMIKRQQSLK